MEAAESTNARWSQPEELAPAIPDIGDRIGRYTITGLLGRGAMGNTFAGRDDELQRPVALKILRRHGGQLARERSAREARAASALNHPNIVTVFEVVQVGESAAIVMELVDGKLLRHHCRRSQSPGMVVSTGRQLAEALAAAHAAGIIHRDVKPENIIIRGDGYIKLLDFGLARQVESGASAAAGGAGTLRYMSPERAAGFPVNSQTPEPTAPRDLHRVANPAASGIYSHVDRQIFGLRAAAASWVVFCRDFAGYLADLCALLCQHFN